MDVTLQRHFAKFIYVVPDGLRELISDVSREVLRSQPDDLYTFIADYLDALMVTRENARVASRLIVDILQISETTAELLQKTGLKRNEANRAATVIQKKFKKFIEIKHPDKIRRPQDPELIVAEILEEANISLENAENAAMIIQKAFRSFLQRRDREKQLLGGMIDWRVAARSAIALYRKTGATYQEAHRAATLIKSAYKGYYQRKVMDKLVEEVKAGESLECLCDMYSIDVPAIEATRVISEECICPADSDNILARELAEEPCLCEYTSSELIKIGKGEKIITDAGFEPLAADEEEDDEFCHCEKNPTEIEELIDMTEPIEQEITVKHIDLLYEDDDKYDTN
ncbi:hypothetical protein HHI36_012513 [Cryptolaemus montrouzieri]|uniref:RIIa domain-containing protein n=1 Tax=Cryptolaemus montrouzieri TaxID=559131 RepID=A0ABD2NEH0_9CUCU